MQLNNNAKSLYEIIADVLDIDIKDRDSLSLLICSGVLNEFFIKIQKPLNEITIEDIEKCLNLRSPLDDTKYLLNVLKLFFTRCEIKGYIDYSPFESD